MDALPTALAVTRTSNTMRARARGSALVMTRRLGRYELCGLLGEGGMGSVFEAFDPVLERAVAIKVARRDTSRRDEYEARLLREAVAMARLEHPNVIRVYDAGTEAGESFLAMELVRGGTLTAWLGEQPRSTRAVIAAYVQAGRGLAAAHDTGLVHRDFKPDNVLVGGPGTSAAPCCIVSTSLPSSRPTRQDPAPIEEWTCRSWRPLSRTRTPT